MRLRGGSTRNKGSFSCWRGVLPSPGVVPCRRCHLQLKQICVRKHKAGSWTGRVFHGKIILTALGSYRNFAKAYSSSNIWCLLTWIALSEARLWERVLKRIDKLISSLVFASPRSTDCTPLDERALHLNELLTVKRLKLVVSPSNGQNLILPSAI